MKKALGKGLSALIPDTYLKKAAAVPENPALESVQTAAVELKSEPSQTVRTGAFRLIALTDIVPNQDQPRKEFSPEGIEELAASIREKGILQPILVSQQPGGKYTLICGERRLRAARLCGLTEIPVIIKDIAADDFLEWALIENIQRQDLNAIEEAEAYLRLAEERMLSQEEIAKRVGKDRATVANAIRLLRLPDEIRQFLAGGELTAGHARALLGMLTPEHQRQLARRIVQDKLSVRQTEAIVNRSNAHKRKPRTARHLKPEIVDLERRLSEHFGTQVKIYPRKDQQQGRLEIQYFSLDDLDRILERAGLPSQ